MAVIAEASGCLITAVSAAQRGKLDSCNIQTSNPATIFASIRFIYFPFVFVASGYASRPYTIFSKSKIALLPSPFTSYPSPNQPIRPPSDFGFCNHLITRSALASTFGGIVRPIRFAASRLIISSNLDGSVSGNFSGLAPFRI